jgi:quercetin dioxygenase-like cupin family protein
MSNFHNLGDTVRSMAASAGPDGASLVRGLTMGEEVMAGVVRSGGDPLALHRQPAHEELLVVLDGEGDFRVGDEVRHVAPGDFIFVPRDAVHGTVATEGAPLAFLSIFAPRVDLASDVVWETEPPAFRVV